MISINRCATFWKRGTPWLYKKINYKPVSRILYHPPKLWQGGCCYHLSCPGIAAGIVLPTHPTSPVCKPESDEPPFNAGIHGISACKVYPSLQLPAETVSSYPTFSPSPSVTCERLQTNPPSLKRWQTKAVIFCGTVCPRSRSRHMCRNAVTGARLFTGTLPCAVQTFLPDRNQDDSPVCSCCKGS